MKMLKLFRSSKQKKRAAEKEIPIPVTNNTSQNSPLLQQHYTPTFENDLPPPLYGTPTFENDLPSSYINNRGSRSKEIWDNQFFNSIASTSDSSDGSTKLDLLYAKLRNGGVSSLSSAPIKPDNSNLSNLLNINSPNSWKRPETSDTTRSILKKNSDKLQGPETKSSTWKQFEILNIDNTDAKSEKSMKTTKSIRWEDPHLKTMQISPSIRKTAPPSNKNTTMTTNTTGSQKINSSKKPLATKNRPKKETNLPPQQNDSKSTRQVKGENMCPANSDKDPFPPYDSSAAAYNSGKDPLPSSKKSTNSKSSRKSLLPCFKKSATAHSSSEDPLPSRDKSTATCNNDKDPRPSNDKSAAGHSNDKDPLPDRGKSTVAGQNKETNQKKANYENPLVCYYSDLNQTKSDQSNRMKSAGSSYVRKSPFSLADLPEGRCDDTTVLPTDPNNQGFPLEGHAECLLFILQDILKNKALCDVVIEVPKRKFNVHRLVLCSCTGFFYDKIIASGPSRDQRLGKTESIFVPNVSSKVMEVLLNSMYTGRLNINDRNIRSILLAARQLQYYAAERACEEYMQAAVTTSNCYSSLGFAFTNCLPNLAETCFKCIAYNFEEMTRGSPFRSLTPQSMVTILCRDDLNVPGELLVFDRMLDWINCDIPNRLCYAGDLLREVRLPLMPASDIIDQVESTSYLMEVPECRQLVKEALHYHCLPAKQSILQNARTRPRTTYQMDVVFAIGGAPRRLKDPVSDEIIAFNPKYNQWEFVTNLPQPIHHAGVAVLGGFIYVVGGESRNDHKSPVNKAHRYDPRTGNWLRIANMKRARQSFELCASDNRLYAIGGRVHHNLSLDQVERYNPARDTWKAVAPLSSPRRAMAAASFDGYIYVAGGTGDPKKFERYNVSSNCWEQRQPLLQPRFFASLVEVKKKLYLVGGATTIHLVGGATTSHCNIPSGVTSVQCYCPIVDMWTTIQCTVESRAEGGCTVLNNTIYIMGGYNWNTRTRLKSVELVDVEAGSLNKIPDIPTPYTGISCCTTTICDLTQIVRPQSSAYNDRTCTFYHHCSQSSVTVDHNERLPNNPRFEEISEDMPWVEVDIPLCPSDKTTRDKKAKEFCKPESGSKTKVKKKKKRPKVNKPDDRKHRNNQCATKCRLTRASSCENPISKGPAERVKLPKIKATKVTKQ